MGEVWAARDLELDRLVALKLLGPTADPARFEREAHAAAALSHPNVTQLFDYGAWEGRPYMVLEFLPGGTLEDRLRDGRPLPDAQTERIAREVAAGLAPARRGAPGPARTRPRGPAAGGTGPSPRIRPRGGGREAPSSPRGGACRRRPRPRPPCWLPRPSPPPSSGHGRPQPAHRRGAGG